ncbi:hypothetical protein NDA18_001470 [Ustilago nuda]|nr:hypothetical protein NDA18_001470 [Ustilago nuda]
MSSTTTTATTTTNHTSNDDLADVDLTTSASGTAVRGGNRGKMTSTWHAKPASEWDFFERSLVHLGITPRHSLQAGPAKPPVYPKTAPVPVFPIWKMHRLILPRALAPIVSHALFTHFTGIQVPVYMATVYYLAYFVWFGAGVFAWCNQMTDRFGTFDGSAGRDGVPDLDTWRVAIGLFMVVISRAVIAVPYLYKPSERLFTWNTVLMLPVNMAIYAIAVDFYFYWYHRLMHEVPFLWRLHRKHHTTKHPIAALGAFADHEQEFFDMVGIPIMAWLTWRINFTTWWICTCYILFIEASGHSGLRGYFQNPATWFLRYVGAELCLEDHDIHHRNGWKKSGNYGKQTRLWDAIFGTMKERIEGTADNINWNDHMDVPQPVPKQDK